jgi:hypothetical protein
MKKLMFCLIILFCAQGFATATAMSEKEPPPYAKWGTIAVKETIKKYPYSDVVDYLHIGREEKNSKLAVEKFKLWLRHGEKEFGVFVDVTFDKQTNEFKQISFRETMS